METVHRCRLFANKMLQEDSEFLVFFRMEYYEVVKKEFTF